VSKLGRPWLVNIDGGLFGDFPTQEKQMAALPEAPAADRKIPIADWVPDGNHGPGWTRPEPASGEWRASRAAVRVVTRWRCAVFWYSVGRWWPPVAHCPDKHKTAGAARACAQREAGRRNRCLLTMPEMRDA
jgi:hypothetical protein